MTDQLPTVILSTAGASITVGITMTLLLAFIVQHKLTNKAVTDLLYIIEIICPKPNKCLKTHHLFKNFFSFLVTSFKFCYYCLQCTYPISDTATKVCGVCKSVFNSVKDLNYFLHISISDQIKALYSWQNFFLPILLTDSQEPKNINSTMKIFMMGICTNSTCL